MFQTNEYIIYGRTGVCLVEGIEQIDGKDYYCLHALHQHCHIKAPVNGITPIRAVISREQAEALIDMIPSIIAKPMNSSNIRELNEKYKSLVSSRDCRDLLTLTMSIYAKKQQLQTAKKKLSSTDEAYWKEGEGLLFGELAVALGIRLDDVQNYIRQRLNEQKPIGE